MFFLLIFSLFSENGIILRDSIPTLELFQSLYDKIRFNFVLCEKLLSVPTVLQVNSKYLHIYFQ